MFVIDVCNCMSLLICDVINCSKLYSVSFAEFKVCVKSGSDFTQV